MHQREIILVTGGVKSGKSAWALARAEQLGDRRAFVATATALDEEMRKKIAAHQAERGRGWETIEAPRALSVQLAEASGRFDVVLVDCLTMWVSNLLTLEHMTPEDIQEEAAALQNALRGASSPVVLVTNEVSMGIMPADRLSRQYQNLLGLLNRDIARIATSVHFMISGIAQQIR